MTKLLSLGQFADGDTVAFGKTFDGQQRLMLLGRDVGGLRRRFAEMDESPERVTERRERFILFLAELFGPWHWGVFNTGFTFAAIIYLTIS